jgi:hypothetical protein
MRITDFDLLSIGCAESGSRTDAPYHERRIAAALSVMTAGEPQPCCMEARGDGIRPLAS